MLTLRSSVRNWSTQINTPLIEKKSSISSDCVSIYQRKTCSKSNSLHSAVYTLRFFSLVAQLKGSHRRLAALITHIITSFLCVWKRQNGVHYKNKISKLKKLVKQIGTKYEIPFPYNPIRKIIFSLWIGSSSVRFLQFILENIGNSGVEINIYIGNVSWTTEHHLCKLCRQNIVGSHCLLNTQRLQAHLK